MTLSNESLRQIDRELDKYPAEHRRSAIISALRIAQVEKGWLSPELIEEVALYVGVSPSLALEVATFYNMFDLKPVGKIKISVCTNLPCALGGSIDTAEYLKSKLGIGFGETTGDGRYTLIESECLGACCDAPVILVNNHRMCARMTREEIDKKLAELG